MSRISSRLCLAMLAVLGLALAGPALAQQQSGNLYGRVADAEGKALAGATVTVSGHGAPPAQTTDALGEFRFLGLSPGIYQLRAEHAGSPPIEYTNVTIAVGRNTTLEVRIGAETDAPAAPTVADVITIVAESPQLDRRKLTTGTSITSLELEKIPTSRDPWSILQQAPGVLSDRINVGGNEGGQQSLFISPGTNCDNSQWSVDGVVVTDMGAVGSSPTYYNFDSFDEMQVATGGTDVSLATGGVMMNLVTKRGGNEWRFSGRYLEAEESWQSDLAFEGADLGEGGPWNGGHAQAGFAQGNRIVSVQDYGLEGGGPVVADRLWAWASYGVQDIDLLTIDDVSDKTELESYAGKINAQPTSSNSLVAFYHFGDKVKIGRNASPTRPQPTTWNQAGPSDIYKLEDTQLFSSALYLTAMASYVGGGFELVPQGGGIGDPDFPAVVRGPDRAWRGSFLLVETDRPQRQAKADGSYFFGLGETSHELRFGAGYRSIEVESFSTWPGLQIVGLADLQLAEDVYLGFSRTESRAANEIDYASAYLQDTLTHGRLTANLGLRIDLQEGENLPTTVAPAPVDAGGVLVAGSFAGSDPGFSWETVTPRLGATYALGAEQQTLVRASYSRFADQLSNTIVGSVHPGNYQYGYFLWYDDGDLALTEDEVGSFFAFAGVDPRNPGLHTVSSIDPGLEAPATDEVVLSLEHALRPELVVGLSVTGRRYSEIVELERLILETDAPVGSLGRPHRREDYVLSDRLVGTLPDGSAFDVPVYSLAPGLAFNGGFHLRNGDREQEYLGVTANVHKRLANRWLLRGHVTWSDWEWDVPASEDADPTHVLPGNSLDGGAVLVGGATNTGPKGDIFINSNWSFDLSALYQVAPERPWGFNVAANLNGREGYPVPYNIAFNPGDDIGTRNVLALSDVERFRNDDVVIVNARIEKELTLGELGLTLSLDGFNLTNEGFVLQRDSALAATRIETATGFETPVGNANGDFVREVVSPRIFRLGARISFR